jgi:hypothetical protein
LLGNVAGPVGARTRQGFIVLVAVLTAVVALSSSAPAQEHKKRDPTPQELWNAYPLDPPKDGVAFELPASATPGATPAPAAGASGPWLVLVVALIAGVFAVGVLFGARRRPQRSETRATRLPESPPAPPRNATLPARRFRSARAPIPDDAWSCYIAWRGGPRGARFRALARAPGADSKRVQIARSGKIDWPPFLPPTASPELVASASALAGALVEAGWQPTDRGEFWYSQRFVWRGSAAPEPLGEIAPRTVVQHG